MTLISVFTASRWYGYVRGPLSLRIGKMLRGGHSEERGSIDFLHVSVELVLALVDLNKVRAELSLYYPDLAHLGAAGMSFSSTYERWKT